MLLFFRYYFFPLVPPGLKWYSCRKVHPWCGSPLVLRQRCATWHQPGNHPWPLPGVLPVWHRGLRWLEPAKQRSDAGKLGQSWTVCTWHYRGKIILSDAWRFVLVQSDPLQKENLTSCELFQKGESPPFVLQCRLCTHSRDCRPAGHQSKLELVFSFFFLHSLSREIGLLPFSLFCMGEFRLQTLWESRGICLCRRAIPAIVKQNASSAGWLNYTSYYKTQRR